MFKKELDYIKDEKIKESAKTMVNLLPDYFFEIPASSTGKYHPKFALGDGGLVRHSINVKRMLVHLLLPNGYYDFTPREKVLLQVAALFHDSFKSGFQSDYEENIHTKFLHPVLAANHIIMESVKFGFNYEDAQFMASAIISHMGQWNTSWREKGILPLPLTPAQKVLHLADYLASRKDINITPPEDPDEEVADTTDEIKKESE